MNIRQLAKAFSRAVRVSGHMVRDDVNREWAQVGRLVCFQRAFRLECKDCRTAPSLGIRY